jgi:hypothetical protein
MEEIPIMEPPGGDWVESCFAPAWIVWNAPVRFVVMVWFQRSGVILYTVSLVILQCQDVWLHTPRIP